MKPLSSTVFRVVSAGLLVMLALAALPMTPAQAAQAAPPARMLAAIGLRGTATTATVTNNASLTINKPTGVASGDVMIANLVEVNSLTAPTAPAGWTSIDGRSLAGGTNRYARIFYKVAGGSEPTSYTFTVPTGFTVTATGGIVAFSRRRQ